MSMGTEAVLLLTNIQKIRGSPTLSRMLRSWKKAKAAVKWKAERGPYPAHLSLQQMITLKQWGANSARSDTAATIALLKRGGINTLAEGKRIGVLDGSWLQHLRSCGHFLEEDQGREIQNLETWLANTAIIDKPLLQMEKWEWKDGKQGLGYFTGSRAKEIGVSTGFCDRCEEQVETIEHIFLHCWEARSIRETLVQLGAINPCCDSLLRWIDDCLDKGRANVAFVNVLANFFVAQWKSCNHRIFRHQRAPVLISPLLKSTHLDIEVFPGPKASDRMMTLMTMSKRTVGEWKLTWEHRRQGTHDGVTEEQLTLSGRRQEPSMVTRSRSSLDTESSASQEVSLSSSESDSSSSEEEAVPPIYIDLTLHTTSIESRD
ncbi:hypothetical protein R1sor_013286 [Riccia sorocarpa]|uniref:Reverse transcriptase zinc-binding domain-containing protein n=1 Tax=Riccia sorocarpa TaxID=122646 RepID=A0ABD3H8T1_9MARC